MINSLILSLFFFCSLLLFVNYDFQNCISLKFSKTSFIFDFATINQTLLSVSIIFVSFFAA